MKISKKDAEEMLDAAKPLISWLNEKTHPHCELRVTTTSVELSECSAIEKTFEFVKD